MNECMDHSIDQSINQSINQKHYLLQYKRTKATIAVITKTATTGMMTKIRLNPPPVCGSGSFLAAWFPPPPACSPGMVQQNFSYSLCQVLK